MNLGKLLKGVGKAIGYVLLDGLANLAKKAKNQK